MIEFLELKAIQIAPSQDECLRKAFSSDVKSTTRRESQRKPTSVMLATDKKSIQPAKEKFTKYESKNKCAVCGKDHQTFRCPDLLTKSTTDRISKIRNLKLCLTCLQSHFGEECKIGLCPYCNENHNLVLCLKRERDSAQKSESKIQSKN